MPNFPRVLVVAVVISPLVPRAMTYSSGVYPADISLSNMGVYLSVFSTSLFTMLAREV